MDPKADWTGTTMEPVDTQQTNAMVEDDYGSIALPDGVPTAEEVLMLLAEAESRSEQIGVIQRCVVDVWSTCGRDEVTPQDAVAVLGKLNKAETRQEQLRVLHYQSVKLTTFAALDAAVRPLRLSAPQFGHILKLVHRAAASGLLRPSAFAALLDQSVEELGCFLSAAQAQELVEQLAAPPTEEAEYWHIACARVVDPCRAGGPEPRSRLHADPTPTLTARCAFASCRSSQVAPHRAPARARRVPLWVGRDAHAQGGGELRRRGR